MDFEFSMVGTLSILNERDEKVHPQMQEHLIKYQQRGDKLLHLVRK